MGVCKVHFGNHANEQMATTEPTGDTSQPDLIDYINNQVQVATRTKEQAISQGKNSHFQASKHLPSSGSTTAHPDNVCHLMLDDNTMYGSLLTSSQKYMAKAANFCPDKVKYDGITYKICMSGLMTYCISASHFKEHGALIDHSANGGIAGADC
jgi:hypothetical protein